MLYDEFIAGTGCRDTAKNYKVFRDLEILYMNSDEITKAEIYEYGKKLVDNNLTEAQVAWNADIDAKIKELKARIEVAKTDLLRYVDNYNFYKAKGFDNIYAEDLKFWRQCVKEEKQNLKKLRGAVRELKGCKYV